MTDHTPSPATDGLREAVEALATCTRGRDGGPCGDCHQLGGHGLSTKDLRAVLAAHPAPPSETSAGPVPCAVQFCSALRTQGLFCDRHAYKNPLPVSSDEETQP